MEEKQEGKSEDKLDIEIIDLDDKSVSDQRQAFSTFRISRFVPKQRRTQAILTTSIVILVLLGIIGSTTAVQTKLLALSMLTPTQTIPAGTDSFYVDGEPEWGRLFVDGKLISHTPNAYNGDIPLHLLRGVHRLRWVAAPFLPQMCTVSVPPNFRIDTCGYNQMVSNNQSGGWLFKFPVSLTKLPSAQQKALITAIQTVLQTYTSTEIAQPGEVYATDSLGLQHVMTHEPLKVMVHYNLDTDTVLDSTCGPYFFVDNPHSCSNQGRDCRVFCNASQYFVPQQTQTQVWDVFVTVRVTFEYTTLGGKPIVQTSERVDSTRQYEHFLPLQISLNGTQWHVVSSSLLLLGSMPTQIPAFICDTAQRKAENSSFLDGTFGSSFSGMAWRSISLPDTASCLNVVTTQQSLTSVEAQPYALCLYRFGVFLAANQLAHKYWPHMQLATADEQRIAQQVYSTSPST